MKTPHVWVIEIQLRGKFKPCACAEISQKDAERELRYWNKNNPDDQFRIAKYVRSVK